MIILYYLCFTSDVFYILLLFITLLVLIYSFLLFIFDIKSGNPSFLWECDGSLTPSQQIHSFSLISLFPPIHLCRWNSNPKFPIPRKERGWDHPFPHHPWFLHLFPALPLILDFLLVPSRVEFQAQAASFPGMWAQIPFSCSCIPTFHLLLPCPPLLSSEDPPSPFPPDPLLRLVWGGMSRSFFFGMRVIFQGSGSRRSRR